MTSLETAGQAWIEHGWPALLAFTMAVALVFIARKAYRRVFGAEHGFQLWLLPALAWVVALLPHSAQVRVVELPPVIHAMTAAGAALNTHAAARTLGAQGWLLLAWLVGALFTLGLAAIAQWRFRKLLHDAARIGRHADRWLLLRAARTDIGPAMVGAWRPCIVLPADFERRYDPTERMLILAHESMHARRFDGAWRLLAQLLLALLWFHPLAWLGWSAFQHDQELACDAAVVREHCKQRRHYANAMLKTQAVTVSLPIGCSWSPRHPLTERIAMLTRKTPSTRRRVAGVSFLLVLISAVAGLSNAASREESAVIKAPAQYQVAITVSRGDRRLVNSTVCARLAQPAAIVQQNGIDGDLAWRFKFTLEPAGADQVQVAIQGSLDEAGQHREIAPIVRGPLGKPMTVTLGGKTRPILLSIAPIAGCQTHADAAVISESIKHSPARDAAQELATRAGFMLVNPESLDERPITFNFEQVTAADALRLVAKVDGRQAWFDGKRVR
jgi:beta-lactamase regulating signal transducer with metallopeptidase domain